MSWDGKIYDKYRIEHTDGTPLKGEKYFVLRLDSDDPVEAARVSAAMRAYKNEPRNYERFEIAEDAKKEFNYLWNFVWKRGGGYVDEREYRSEYEKWLFSPMQEGETNGSR